MKSPKIKNDAWLSTPPDIWAKIKKAEEAVVSLQALAKAEGIERRFTLDGRLVGDIGELVVARYFEIVRDEKPKGHAHDLFAIIGGKKRGVQVKLRRETKSGDLTFKYQPEVLVTLKFKGDWSKFQIVYHGSGAVIARDGATVDGQRRFRRGGDAAEIRMTPAEFEAAAKSKKHPALQLVRRKG